LIKFLQTVDGKRSRHIVDRPREQSQDGYPVRSPSVLTFPVPPTDTGLVSALRANHPDGVRVLCDRFSGELLKVAARILGPDAGVRALATETLRWSLRHLDELTDPRLLRLWLLSRLVVLSRRRIRMRPLLFWQADGRSESGSCGVCCSDQLVSTYRLLDRIDIDQRIAFCLLVLHSTSLAETAAVLGVSCDLVKRKLAAAHARFRHLARSKLPSLMREHISHAALGVEIAKEQDHRIGCSEVSEFDLVRSDTRPRWSSLLHTKRAGWLLALAPLVVGLVIAVAVSVTYFRAVQYQVNGKDPAPAPSVRLGHWVVAPQQRSETVSFSDGSLIAMAPGARIRVVSTNYRGGTSILESGSVNLSVVNTGRAEYQVVAGPFVLLLSKGKAELSWDPENELLGVTVHQGNLVISGCQFHNGNSVIAGMTLEARCRTQASAE